VQQLKIGDLSDACLFLLTAQNVHLFGRILAITYANSTTQRPFFVINFLKIGKQDIKGVKLYALS
jgi:hypothetical protein